MQRSSSAADGDESSAVADHISRCAADLAHEAAHMQHEKLCRMGSRAQPQAAAHAGGSDDIPAAHALSMAWQVRILLLHQLTRHPLTTIT